MHTDELLEKHDPDTHKGALPASTPKAVEPRLYLKLDTVHTRRSLKGGMPRDTDFVVEGNLSPDLTPFLKDTRVVGRKVSKLSEYDERFIVTAFAREPARRERQKYDANAEDEAWNDLEQER
jgi:hypothetical protein